MNFIDASHNDKSPEIQVMLLNFMLVLFTQSSKPSQVSVRGKLLERVYL